jgi:hypothetical protein
MPLTHLLRLLRIMMTLLGVVYGSIGSGPRKDPLVGYCEYRCIDANRFTSRNKASSAARLGKVSECNEGRRVRGGDSPNS